ncbi:GNAT family N-acetyltransferase, partial [Bradyrhizobium sp. PRIMUS42]|uniref:GNAT family N-acetyltransferase n=1 Tax=Bradyrhizobium sp. PRIMUS42 TaxID=2908926 RepID=UPI001FF30BC3
ASAVYVQLIQGTPLLVILFLGYFGLAAIGLKVSPLAATGALKTLSASHGEVKSMHTLRTTRRRGFGGQMLRHIISEGRARGLTRLSLETGSWAYFKPAHALYRAHGFVLCGPFEGYVEDPNSLFLTLDLSGR